MSPSLQVADALAAACAQATAARRRLPAGHAAAGRILVGRSDRRHHARIRFHFAGAVAASAGRTAFGIRPPRPLIDKAVRSILARQLPDGGFNIYAERAFRNQRDRQGVHRAEAGRALTYDDPNLTRAARAHSGAGRPAGGQQLRQDQPQPVRAVSARAHAVDSARGACCWAS